MIICTVTEPWLQVRYQLDFAIEYCTVDDGSMPNSSDGRRAEGAAPNLRVALCVYKCDCEGAMCIQEGNTMEGMLCGYRRGTCI